MEELKLDGPPQRIWNDCQTAVRDLLGVLGEKSGWYSIGGGTILAARFHHRRSSDIDLLIGRQPELRGWSGTHEDWKDRRKAGAESGRPGEDRFREAMAAVGGETSVSATRELVVVQFGGDHERLEMLASGPVLEAPGRFAKVDGTREEVLSNGQILSGKLQRAANPPVRDMFDMVVAGIADPEAVEQAMNNVGVGATTAMKQLWQGLDGWLAKKAGEARGINREGLTAFAGIDTTRLGSLAGETVVKNLYREAEIVTHGGAVKLRTISYAGAEREKTAGPEGAALFLVENGLRAACGQTMIAGVPRVEDLGYLAEKTAKKGRDVTIGVVREGFLEEWYKPSARGRKRGAEVQGYKRPDRGGGGSGGGTGRRNRGRQGGGGPDDR